MCLCLCVCITNMHFGQKMATLFVLMGASGCAVLYARGLRVNLCAIGHWYSIALSTLWPNRSHHVCVRRTGFIPSRPAACWCSFQPVRMDYSFLSTVRTCAGVWCFWRYVWMLHTRIASMSGMCMLQWFQGQQPALAGDTSSQPELKLRRHHTDTIEFRQ